jgi:putative transposase
MCPPSSLSLFFLPFFLLRILLRNHVLIDVTMPRTARFVIPDVPHHVIQRGNRRQAVFFSDEDMLFYLALALKWSHRARLSIWAYCLMENHVHFVAVPHLETSLAKTFAEIHKRYSHIINKRHGWRGYLWQGRFLSYPMDDPYLYRAIRYVELNPVRAGVVKKAEDYPWSSARAHLLGEKNLLLKRSPLGMGGEEWSRYLAEGLMGTEAEVFREHAKAERPLGGEGFRKRIGIL